MRWFLLCPVVRPVVVAVPLTQPHERLGALQTLRLDRVHRLLRLPPWLRLLQPHWLRPFAPQLQKRQWVYGSHGSYLPPALRWSFALHARVLPWFPVYQVRLPQRPTPFVRGPPVVCLRPLLLPHQRRLPSRLSWRPLPPFLRLLLLRLSPPLVATRKHSRPQGARQ